MTRHGLILAALATIRMASPAHAARIVDVGLGQQDFTAYGSPFAGLMTDFNGLAVGDLDADGRVDLVVSERESDGPPPRTRTGAGAVHVLFGPLARGGSFDAFTQSADVTAYGAVARDGLGNSVAVGDLSGDGIDDLVMGAWLASGPGGTRTEAGRALVLFGPRAAGDVVDFATSVPDVLVMGASVRDILGYDVLVADLSGDGAADLVVSARHADGPGDTRTDSGELHVFFGPLATGTVLDLAATPADVVVFGADPADYIGVFLAAGDVSGDGFVDLVIGGYQGDGPGNSRAESGEVNVLFGPFAAGTTRDLAAGADVTVYGAHAIDAFGGSVATGDVNGDCVPDLVAGSRHGEGGRGELYAGRAHAFFGPLLAGTVIDLATTSADVTVIGPHHLAMMGEDLDVADVTGDGIEDLILGGGQGRTTMGTVVLFGPFSSGRVVDLATEAPDVAVIEDDEEDRLGAIVAAGDVLGDGVADVLIGAPFGEGPADDRNAAGEAYVVSIEPNGSGSGSGRITCPDDLVVECDGAGNVAERAAWIADFRAGGCGVGVPTLDSAVVPGPCPGTSVETVTFAVGVGSSRQECVRTFSIVDTKPPSVTPGSGVLGCLWSPNHRFACLTADELAPEIVDACSGGVRWRIVDCASDQSPDDQGDGSFAPDCRVSTDGRAVCVRAERSGLIEAGRTYTLSIVAEDACGNASAPTAIGQIHVPHDRRDGRRNPCGNRR